MPGVPQQQQQQAPCGQANMLQQMPRDYVPVQQQQQQSMVPQAPYLGLSYGHMQQQPNGWGAR